MSKARDLADLPQGSGDLYVDGNVGIGTSSPDSNARVTIDSGTDNGALFLNSTDGDVALSLADSAGHVRLLQAGGELAFRVGGDANAMYTGDSEAMRIDSSGNLHVGKTSTSTSTVGTTLLSNGRVTHTAASDSAVELNRTTSDGAIINFRKDNTSVGSIGTRSSNLSIGSGDVSLEFNSPNDAILPSSTLTNNTRDGAIDLGLSSARFDDIYINGTINTSDRNEKQDIVSFTSTEMNVAKRISAMFKKFRWIDSVTEKGDAARTHSGVIAQDVQQAFTDEGLDAGDYGLFISTTWWETQTDVPAVEAVDEVLDDDGNVVTEAVEAKDAYTRTDTYETQAEAPAGATERTRMGIRYPQLLSFLAAYNEQRFSVIEARLDALEV